MSWTVQKTNLKNLTHPTPGVGGLGVKISKVREISWTAEKIDKYFFYPPRWEFLGVKKTKVREMSWTAEKSHKKIPVSATSKRLRFFIDK